MREEGANELEMQLGCAPPFDVRETVEPSLDGAPRELELHAEGYHKADVLERDSPPSITPDEQSVLPPPSPADLKDFRPNWMVGRMRTSIRSTLSTLPWIVVA